MPSRVLITEALLGNQELYKPVKTDKWFRDNRFVIDADYVMDFPASVKVNRSEQECLKYDTQTDKALKTVRKSEKSQIFQTDTPYQDRRFIVPVFEAHSDKWSILFNAEFEIFLWTGVKRRLWVRNKHHRGLIVEDSYGKIVAVAMGMNDLPE